MYIHFHYIADESNTVISMCLSNGQLNVNYYLYDIDRKILIRMFPVPSCVTNRHII